MYKLIFATIIWVSLGCKKDRGSDDKIISRVQLLTQKPWRLSGYGLDENSNDRIDPGEESMEDCQTDDQWIYYPDGTGHFDEKTLSCTNGIGTQDFTWKFTDKGRAIDFFYDSMKILRLDQETLVLYKEINASNGSIVKFITTYRH